jgi:hypothetical protein
MEIIYFKKSVRSDIHVHAGSCADFFYVPEDNTLICRLSAGSFGLYGYIFLRSIFLYNTPLTPLKRGILFDNLLK